MKFLIVGNVVPVGSRFSQFYANSVCHVPISILCNSLRPVSFVAL